MLLDRVMQNETFREFLKTKAHTWLPAYFSRHDLTPEETLEISKKEALEEALLEGSLHGLQDTLDRFPELLNQPLNNGELAIIFAVKKGLPEMIDELLKRGADPTSKNRLGLNSLDIALQKQDRNLFAKLVAHKTTLGTEGDFLKSLDRTIVTGYSAKTSLTQLETTQKKELAEIVKVAKELSKEEKAFLEIIQQGLFVKFSKTATVEKLAELEAKIGNQKLLTAAVIGSPLILEQLLEMGFQYEPSKDDSELHPLQFAFCSKKHPTESYIPFFEKLGFDIHSVAPKAPEPSRLTSWAYAKQDDVSFFDLFVYSKKKSASEMDPIAVTGWDIAFASFSLLSFFGNYRSDLVPEAALPYVSLGLRCSNYLQAVSMLLFKLSYVRQGDVSEAMKQLMMHYTISRYLPVRIMYAGMTVYSALSTCRAHRYRSYTDLSKKLIVQLPVATEFVYFAGSTLYSNVQAVYKRFFAPTETHNYNWNVPSPGKSNIKAGSQLRVNKGASSDVAFQNPNTTSPITLENTPFMKKFGEESLKANSKQPTAVSEQAATTMGSVFRGDGWVNQGLVPRKKTTYSGAVEFGKDFHKGEDWYKAIAGTPLEQYYKEMHLQAAATGSISEYNDGFSVEAAFRVDFQGKSALRHFVDTIVEGGAHFEQINRQEGAVAPKGSAAEFITNGLNCVLFSEDKACRTTNAILEHQSRKIEKYYNQKAIAN